VNCSVYLRIIISVVMKTRSWIIVMTTAEASLPHRMAKPVESASGRQSWCIGLKRSLFGRCRDICMYLWYRIPVPRMLLIPRYFPCLFRHTCTTHSHVMALSPQLPRWAGVVSNISQCQIALICATAHARSRKVSYAAVYLVFISLVTVTFR